MECGEVNEADMGVGVRMIFYNGSGCQWEWIRKWWYLSMQSYILPLMIFGLSRALLVAGDLLQRTNQTGTTNCICL
jgi:hypothetical protein